jgi:hypothetical protein
MMKLTLTLLWWIEGSARGELLLKSLGLFLRILKRIRICNLIGAATQVKKRHPSMISPLKRYC